MKKKKKKRKPNTDGPQQYNSHYNGPHLGSKDSVSQLLGMLWKLGIALANQVAVTQMTSPFREVHIQSNCLNLQLIWRNIVGSEKLAISIEA